MVDITLPDGTALTGLDNDQLMLVLSLQNASAAQPSITFERMRDDVEQDRQKAAAQEAREALQASAQPADDDENNGPIKLPLTRDEELIFKLLLEHPVCGLRAYDIARQFDWPKPKVLAHLTRMFSSERGIYKGSGGVYFVLPWAKNAFILEVSDPINHWPPKKGIPR